MQTAEVPPNPTRYDEQHINIIFALLEHSTPVVLSKLCRENPWAKVVTEKDLVTGLMSLADTFLLFGFDVWDVQRVEVTCAGK